MSEECAIKEGKFRYIMHKYWCDYEEFGPCRCLKCGKEL